MRVCVFLCFCVFAPPQVDRCVAPLSVYATIKEKRQKARHPKPATLILEEVYQRQRQQQQQNKQHATRVQFVGASATIGRPLRRELARCVLVMCVFGFQPVDSSDLALLTHTHTYVDAGVWAWTPSLRDRWS